MPFLHVDQRPARERCIAALAMTPGAARLELLQTLDRARLVRGATAETSTDVLLALRARGDEPAYRRYVERAIPVRGEVRRARLGAVELAVVAGLAGLAWISVVGALAVAGGALALTIAWLFVATAPASAMARRERAARAAAKAGDGAALAAHLVEVRRLIAEDRVPAGTGRRLAAILRAGVDAEPLPGGLADDLRRLRDQSPEVAPVFDDVERTIARHLAQRGERDPAVEGERRRLAADYRRLREEPIDATALIAAMHRASSLGDARLLVELHGDARGLIQRGDVPPGSSRALAEVLVARAGVMPFALRLPAELAALRALAPDVDAALADAALARLAELLETITNRPALVEIARTLEPTAPQLAARARVLAG